MRYHAIMTLAMLIPIVYKTSINAGDRLKYTQTVSCSHWLVFKCCACHVETRLDCGGRQKDSNTSQSSSRDNLPC